MAVSEARGPVRMDAPPWRRKARRIGLLGQFEFPQPAEGGMAGF
jgi:hypothetical protein